MSLLRRLPPVLRALLAQALAFGALVALVRLGVRFPPLVWVLLQSVLAVFLSRWLDLGPRWVFMQAALPFLVRALWGAPIPAWVYLLLFLGLALVFGGGLLTRVPLYHASEDAWEKLEGLLPGHPGARFVDLGCGFGGPVAHLAKVRPDAVFVGVEASPATWLVAWLRCLPRRNAHIRLGSLWRTDLTGFDVVYAFLSPVPMPALWAKAQRELRPGSRLVSHSFEVPNETPHRVIPVKGREGARLLVFEL
ncbi:MAG: class I SAM-dependent methyltransferase [Geothrix sp.]|uniref:class I SAM-dependent methyltransferase n=1 Tax=Geothrix sp. TaxID=1962974 RepID=UPI001790980C|nr:class I SAM-dependent methyltransferase [Geothrix sp.]NWJ40770.1 class I SAM-dependent methyltransferase [Geothrix sp.]WIL21224.1 MAG: class I SAM-dependent methyltransferase [Geothrix sp.]